MEIRAYTEADAPVLMRLFHETVHRVCRADYGAAALEAWSPTAGLDPVRWRARFARTQPWVAVADGEVVGFLELGSGGHVDCCYVHHARQRRGVGTRLLGHAVAVARTAGLGRLDAEVSITALPFFTRHGFAVIRAQDVERNGEMLRNYCMEKLLAEVQPRLMAAIQADTAG